MKITWFGHSNFRLEFGGKVVLIDPFFTGNPSFKGDRDAAIKGATHISSRMAMPTYRGHRRRSRRRRARW